METIPGNPILEFQPDILVAIKNIYNLENGRMDQSVDILEEWIKKQEHFVNKKYSRPYLERTLVACKGSVEKAKIQIDKLCTLKTLMPTYFTVSSNVRNTFAEVNKRACLIAMPKMTKDYQRIFVIKMKQSLTPALYMDLYRLVVVFTEYIKAHDYLNGVILVDDLRDIDLMEVLSKINLVEFQQVLTLLMKGYGAKLKAIHLVTPSSVIEMFIMTFKTVLSAKLAARIQVHPDLASLHQALDKELLPVELGGNRRSMNKLQDDWMEELSTKEHEKYLAVMNASRTDESLRQREKFIEQHMGLPGSFRTLTVD